MKSEILNPDLNYVVFTKRANPVSDFDVESTYQRIKDMKYIEISSSLLLNRFLLGVKRKEISQFNLIVEDLDGKIYEEICSEDAKFTYTIWGSVVLNLGLKYSEETLWS